MCHINYKFESILIFLKKYKKISIATKKKENKVIRIGLIIRNLYKLSKLINLNLIMIM